MARYSIPYQNINYEIPDEGVVYRADPWQGRGAATRKDVFVVLNGKINRITGGGSQVPNYNSLPLFTGEISQNYTRQFGAGVVREASPSEIPSLLKATPNPVNYTQTISPTNPNASIVASSRGQVVSAPAPSVSVSPLNPQNVPVNPNLNFQQTGSTSAFTNPVSPTPPGVTAIPSVLKLPNAISGNILASNQSPYNFGQPAQTSYTPASSADATYTKNVGAKQATVVSYRDNSDGTTTNFLSDGTQSTVRYTLNSDGSLTPTEVAQNTKPELGTTETELARRTREAMAGETARLGKASFETAQRQQEGVDNLIKSQDDIASQILMFQAQDKNLEAQMQKQAEGRGITTGGLAPHTASERRDLGIQANILSAQLAATQGKIASANARIAQAVKDRFGPLEEAQKSRIANIEHLLKDPNLSLEEKNRANAQLLIQKQAEAQIALNKQSTADIWKVSTDASANIVNFKPTQEFLTPSLAISAIQNASTKEQALAIALATGLTKPQTALSDFEQAFLRNKGRLPTVAELQAYNASQKKPEAPFGSLTSSDESKGMNYLLNSGGTAEDKIKFQTDRAFQAWVLNKAFLAGY